MSARYYLYVPSLHMHDDSLRLSSYLSPRELYLLLPFTLAVLPALGITSQSCWRRFLSRGEREKSQNAEYTLYEGTSPSAVHLCSEVKLRIHICLARVPMDSTQCRGMVNVPTTVLRPTLGTVC